MHAPKFISDTLLFKARLSNKNLNTTLYVQMPIYGVQIS